MLFVCSFPTVDCFSLKHKIARGHHHHRYANWTLKAGNGKYLSVNEHNELVLSELPTVFKVYFIDGNHQFVKLFVTGKGFVKVFLKLIIYCKKNKQFNSLATLADPMFSKFILLYISSRTLRAVTLPINGFD